MGQTGTKVASKIVNSFSFSGAVTDDLDESVERTLVRFNGATPLVYSRRGCVISYEIDSWSILSKLKILEFHMF